MASEQQQQIVVALQLAEAEVELWRARVQTFKAERRAWRGLVDRVLKCAALDVAGELRTYLEADKAASDAEAQLMSLSMAKAQGQAAILQEAIKQFQRPSSLVVPGAG